MGVQCTLYSGTVYNIHFIHNNDDKSGKGKEVVRKYRERKYYSVEEYLIDDFEEIFINK